MDRSAICRLCAQHGRVFYSRSPFRERTNFYPLETTGLGWLCRLTPCLLVAFSCLAFLAGPLFYARRTQAALKIHDFLLQGCNLMASYVALSLLTGRFPSTNYAFLQPLCFTLLLAGTAGYLWKRVPKERTGLYAAAGAAILFSLLIPLYFSYAYAVYAWTAEALLFLLPGLQGKRRPLELAGCWSARRQFSRCSSRTPCCNSPFQSLHSSPPALLRTLRHSGQSVPHGGHSTQRKTNGRYTKRVSIRVSAQPVALCHLCYTIFPARSDPRSYKRAAYGPLPVEPDHSSRLRRRLSRGPAAPLAMM